jgi:hypothetical protein
MASKFTQKKYLIPTLILVVFIVIRLALPSFLLKKANESLAGISPQYAIHIGDLSLSILRGAYTFIDISGQLTEKNKKFLTIKEIDVSIAWREVFKGKILTDIKAGNIDFLVIKDIKQLTPPTKDKSGVRNTLFPVEVSRLDIINAGFSFEGYESFSGKELFKVDKINGRITNLTPTQNNRLTYFNLVATIIDPTTQFKIAGEANQLETPLVWDLDLEVKDFHLNTLNPYFLKHLPLTFTKGTLDVYSEAQSKKGIVKGYVKPFIRELEVIANKEHFISLKHFGFEMISALANLMLRESKTKSIATKFEFTYDKKLNFKIAKSLSKALGHGFIQQLSPGIEDQYNLK